MGDDPKTWTIQMDETVAEELVKTRFYNRCRYLL